MRKIIKDDIAALLESVLEAFPDKIIIEANIALYKKRIFPHHFLGLQVFGYSYQKTIEQLKIETVLRSIEKITSIVPSDMNMIEEAVNGILAHKKRGDIYYDGRITHDERLVPGIKPREKVGLLYPYKITFARDIATSWLIKNGYRRTIERYFGFRSEWVFYLKRKSNEELIINLEPKIDYAPIQTSYLFKAIIEISRQHGEIIGKRLTCLVTTNQIITTMRMIGYHYWQELTNDRIADMKSNLISKVLPHSSGEFIEIGYYNRTRKGYPISILLPF